MNHQKSCDLTLEKTAVNLTDENLEDVNEMGEPPNTPDFGKFDMDKSICEPIQAVEDSQKKMLKSFINFTNKISLEEEQDKR